MRGVKKRGNKKGIGSKRRRSLSWWLQMVLFLSFKIANPLGFACSMSTPKFEALIVDFFLVGSYIEVRSFLFIIAISKD